MSLRTNRPVARPTPSQRRRTAKIVRARARSLAFCNVLAFWRMCRVAACRRHHACRGDAHACFARHWRTVPDEVLAIVRKNLAALRSRA